MVHSVSEVQKEHRKEGRVLRKEKIQKVSTRLCVFCSDTVLRRRISAGTPQQEENLRVFQHTLEEMRLHWFQRQSPVIHLAMI